MLMRRRWSPFEGLSTLHREVDQLFDRFFAASALSGRGRRTPRHPWPPHAGSARAGGKQHNAQPFTVARARDYPQARGGGRAGQRLFLLDQDARDDEATVGRQETQEGLYERTEGRGVGDRNDPDELPLSGGALDPAVEEPDAVPDIVF